MKILLGNNRLANPGGSETYAYAMAAELVQQGHSVDCLASGQSGLVSQKMVEQLGIPVRFKPTTAKYDLVLLSHATSISLAHNVQGFKVQTCHGIFPTLEQPVKGMDAYVAISEEVQGHLRKLRYESHLIRNGVDCFRFFPIKDKTEEELRVVLSLAHSNEANAIIQKACDEMGIKLLVQNKYKRPIWEVEDLINQADLVVGLGRGVYEAAACGRNVIVFDYRSYMDLGAIGDGFVNAHTFLLYLMNNCSGRYRMKQFDAENLQVEMRKYSAGVGVELREFVLENLNIEKQVQKYINLIR